MTSQRRLLMIPGPIEVSPAVREAFAVPPPGHLAPDFIEAFGASIEMMRRVWLAGPASQPFVVPGSGTTAMDILMQSGFATVVEDLTCLIAEGRLRPLDPVATAHLLNGAIMAQALWLAGCEGGTDAQRSAAHAALEAVFVDPHRESSRDVLRNPGGLADTLDDLISVVAIADAAPTDSAQALSQQAIERVGEQLAQLDALLAGELPALNAQLAAAGVTVLGA